MERKRQVKTKRKASQTSSCVGEHCASAKRIVLVGTYKHEPDQLKWIGKRHLYNYPLSTEEAKADNGAWNNVKELWLYSGTKDRRHIYTAELLGVKPRKEFLAEHPDYPKGKGKGHGDYYAVFSVHYKYQPTLEESVVVVRASDFKRTPKVAQAVRAYQAGGELGCLSDYLPAELAPLAHDQLRVCEAAVQLDFLPVLDQQMSLSIAEQVAGGRNRLTCLDFFAGSGLVSAGLSNEFSTIWANDISAKKAAVFNANNTAAVLQVCPIENVRGDLLPNADMSWGSFPCQDLSLAGDINGLFAPRSGLFWQWLRVMDEMPIKPPLLVAENVVGLVSAGGGEYYVTLHNELTKRGYRVGAIMLDALHWLPQSRKRIFVIGIKNGVDVSGLTTDGPIWCHPTPVVKVAKQVKTWIWWKLKEPPTRNVTLDAIIDFDSPCDSPKEESQKLALIASNKIDEINRLAHHRRRAFTGYKRTRNHRQVLEVRTDGVAGCLRTPCGGSSRQILLIAENGHLRTRLLTVREAARLMGAPDTYKIPGSYNDGYMAMGDAVALPVVRFLSESLLAPLAYRANKGDA
jgi:DNA (cytosine-5)-methyltransferase 1